MTSRRGIFFNSKARTTNTSRMNELSTTISNEDSASVGTADTTAAKKKIVLNHTKRTINKSIYSGPRKIFSTNYKANRTQLNHKAFFGGNTDEYDLDDNNDDQATTTNLLQTKTIIQNSTTKIERKQIQTTVSSFRQPTTCAELDETQSYIDDIEYLLAGFQPEKALGDRCLSAVKFAELCTKESFRMHVQTQNVLTRIFSLLKDAPSLPSLNLCTSFILYILSIDVLASQITRSILRLMLDLANKSLPFNPDDQEYKKMKERILVLNKSLPENIFCEQQFNTTDIILETFVNMSRSNLQEFLKDELRRIGGFDVIINAVCSLVQDLCKTDSECHSISTFSLRYKKLCRYITMLEEFSNEVSEQASTSRSDVNRMYISQYNQYSLLHSLSKLLDFSLVELQKYASSTDESATNESSTTNVDMRHTYRDGCKTIMSILVIFTNDCESNGDRLTADKLFLTNLFRLLILIEKSSFSNEHKFDTLALTLNLLINLVQNTKHIYKYIMEENMPDGNQLKIYEYLAKLFCEHELSAARAESHEENDWMMEDVNDDDFDEQSNPKSSNEDGANFNRALQKAAGHMENTFTAAFAGVILAVILLRDRTTYVTQIRDLMPQKKFDTLAFILKKFFVFMHMSHAFTPSGVKTLEELIAMVLSLCG